VTAQLAVDIANLRAAATSAFASPTTIASMVSAIQPQVTAVLNSAAATRGNDQNYLFSLATVLNTLTNYLATKYPS
jgi:ABC-type transporter Mla subunit MlaD